MSVATVHWLYREHGLDRATHEDATPRCACAGRPSDQRVGLGNVPEECTARSAVTLSVRPLVSSVAASSATSSPASTSKAQNHENSTSRRVILLPVLTIGLGLCTSSISSIESMTPRR